MTKTNAKVTVSKDVVSCEMDDDAVLMNLVGGEYYELNSIAASVWSLIQESCSVDEIRSFLLEKYEVSEEQCDKDLQELLDGMTEKGLISIQDEEQS